MISNLNSGNLPKRNESMYLYNELHTKVHSNFINNRKKKNPETIQLFTNWWVSQHGYTIEYSSATRKNRILTHTMTWVYSKSTAVILIVWEISMTWDMRELVEWW
jgi:hypothetical protein